MKTAINPWRNQKPPYATLGPEKFEYNGKPLLTYRGVEVYKNPCGSWDYVFDGMTITQRSGFTKDGAPGVIDEIFGGKSLCNQNIADHLTRHGFTPLSYDAYLVAYDAGERPLGD